MLARPQRERHARQALSQARDSLSDGVAACLHAGSIGLIISIMITALLQSSTSDCSSDAISSGSNGRPCRGTPDSSPCSGATQHPNGGPNPSALAASRPVPLLILREFLVRSPILAEHDSSRSIRPRGRWLQVPTSLHDAFRSMTGTIFASCPTQGAIVCRAVCNQAMLEPALG